MPSVKIISTPTGEAPEEVRKAWVGLHLSIEGLHKGSSRGVLGGAPAPENQNGYLVSYATAREALVLAGRQNAADWWDMTEIAQTDGSLVFGQQFCEYFP